MAPGDACDYCFLAMAHWQLGDKNQARTWYNRPALWMAKHKTQDQELLRCRAEASELLGIAKPVEQKNGK